MTTGIDTAGNFRMELFVEGKLKQTIEAKVNLFTEELSQVGIFGEHHINPEAIKSTIIAYRTFESIIRDEYPNKKNSIEVRYNQLT